MKNTCGTAERMSILVMNIQLRKIPQASRTIQGWRSSYVAGTLLGNPSHGMIAESRIFARDPTLLYGRMVELRDNWYWLGEIEWPGSRLWGLKCFAYVRQNSPHFQELVSSLEEIIEIPSKPGGSGEIHAERINRE